MPLRDATDYQFATPTRRVLVRESYAATAGVGLGEAARRYAGDLKTFLGATGVTVAPEAPTAGGAVAVVVTASLPRDDGEGDAGEATVVRTALLRFGAGPIVELTLNADAGDPAAEAEFRRLLDGARPSGAEDPVAGVRMALLAGPDGGPDHPAGPIRLELTADYHGPESFTLDSTDDAQRFRVEAAEPAAEAAVRSAAVGSILSAGVGVARAEDGRMLRFEDGPTPQLSPGRNPAPPAAYAATTRGPGGAAAAAPGEVVVDGNVRGKPVRVRGSVESGADAETCRQLLRAMDSPG